MGKEARESPRGYTSSLTCLVDANHDQHFKKWLEHRRTSLCTPKTSPSGCGSTPVAASEQHLRLQVFFV